MFNVKKMPYFDHKMHIDRLFCNLQATRAWNVDTLYLKEIKKINCFLIVKGSCPRTEAELIQPMGNLAIFQTICKVIEPL